MRMRQHTEHHEAEAVCDVPDCEWWKSQTGYQTCRRAARKHINETGHTVTVYVQVAKTIYPSDPKERHRAF